MNKMTVSDFSEFKKILDSALAVNQHRVDTMKGHDNPQVVSERERLQGYIRGIREVRQYLEGDRFDLKVSAMRNF